MDARRESPVVPPPPLVSPDGRFYLDDGRWVPLPKQASDPRAIARGVTNGISDFFFRLLLAVFVIPAIMFGVIIGVERIVPERADGVALVATLVVLFGALFFVVRAVD